MLNILGLVTMLYFLACVLSRFVVSNAIRLCNSSNRYRSVESLQMRVRSTDRFARPQVPVRARWPWCSVVRRSSGLARGCSTSCLCMGMWRRSLSFFVCLNVFVLLFVV